MLTRAHLPKQPVKGYQEDCRRLLRTLLFTNYTSSSYVELCGELRARVYELQALSESRIMLQACTKLLTDLRALSAHDNPRMALIVQTLTTLSFVSNFGCGALMERFYALETAWETDSRDYAFRIQYYCLLALAN